MPENKVIDKVCEKCGRELYAKQLSNDTVVVCEKCDSGMVMTLWKKKGDKYFAWLRRKESGGILTRYDEDKLKKDDVLDIIVKLMRDHKIRFRDIEEHLIRTFDGCRK